MKTCTIPGKLFLMGEYSVIDGGEAILAALSPGYTYQVSNVPPHASSPLGLFLAKNLEYQPVERTNLECPNGFGSSTAELLASRILRDGKIESLPELWNDYREDTPNASGADLLVQAQALQFSQLNPGLFEVRDHVVTPILFNDKKNLLFFSSKSTDKLPTHEDLKKLRPKIPVQTVNALVQKLKLALGGMDENYSSLTEFAELISALGLETERARRIRERFSHLRNVIGCKGCGAGLNDVFVVALSTAGPESLKEVNEMGVNLGLTPCGFIGDALWKP